MPSIKQFHFHNSTSMQYIQAGYSNRVMVGPMMPFPFINDSSGNEVHGIRLDKGTYVVDVDLFIYNATQVGICVYSAANELGAPREHLIHDTIRQTGSGYQQTHIRVIVFIEEPSFISVVNLSSSSNVDMGTYKSTFQSMHSSLVILQL